MSRSDVGSPSGNALGAADPGADPNPLLVASGVTREVPPATSASTFRRVVRRPQAIVTGGAGFIGSHLVDRLVAEGFAVLVVDDLSTGSARNVPGAARFERRDVASSGLDAVFRSWRPGVVFHLAAQASVARSVRDPLRDVQVNVIGTHEVARAARAAGSRRLVFVSSGGAVYGETRRVATELTLPAPTSYYGVHKLAAEGHVSLAGVPFSILRPSNVYGPRQVGGLEGAVVAAFLEQTRMHGTLEIYGTGGQTRDFVHVSDVVESLWRLSHPEAPVGIWNVSSGRSITIVGLADAVERAVGRPLPRRHVDRRPGDVERSAISAARLRGLGWRPIVRLSVGLRELLGTDGRDSAVDVPRPRAGREGTRER